MNGAAGLSPGLDSVLQPPDVPYRGIAMNEILRPSPLTRYLPASEEISDRVWSRSSSRVDKYSLRISDISPVRGLALLKSSVRRLPPDATS